MGKKSYLTLNIHSQSCVTCNGCDNFLQKGDSGILIYTYIYNKTHEDTTST